MRKLKRVTHRMDSLIMALRYGSAASSSNDGRRVWPTTASISACAFLAHSGLHRIATAMFNVQIFVKFRSLSVMYVDGC